MGGLGDHMIDERAVQELLDKQEITEVIYRYCRAIDRLDLELFKGVYHEDGLDNHGARKGTGWEFATGAVSGLGSVDQRTQHHITNILIEVDGDVAWAESYLMAYHRFLDPPRLGDNDLDPARPLLEYGGRYVDRLERRDGVWRIAKRVIIYDWSRFSAVEAEYPNHPVFEQGRRDRTDLAYDRTGPG